MLREEDRRIFRELRNSVHKVDNLIDKSKTMCMNMWREGKMRTVDPIGKERETEKRQKRISGERQRLAKILKTFNDAREAEARISASMRDVSRFVKFLEKSIPKYINFWAKNGFLLNKYLLKCPHLFPLTQKKNEKDTAQWFNLEDVKSKADLKACWNFIKEWKRYFYLYEKLEWGERKGSREKTIMRDYYMRHRRKELRDEGKNRKQIYEMLTGEIKKLFPFLYCPETSTHKDASRFWHIVYDKKYDRNEYKKLRVTYDNGKKESTITLRSWYNKVKKSRTLSKI